MSRNRARRYLTLKGNVWWFKRDIPAAIRKAFSDRTAYLISLETSDVVEAAKRRDEIGVQVSRLFADAKAGRPHPVGGVGDFIRTRAERWATELVQSRADPFEWHKKVTGYEPAEDETGVALLDPEDLIEQEAEQISRDLGAAAGGRFVSIAHGHLDVDHHLSAYLKEAHLAPKTTREREALVRRFATWAVEQAHTMTDITRPVAVCDGFSRSDEPTHGQQTPDGIISVLGLPPTLWICPAGQSVEGPVAPGEQKDC